MESEDKRVALVGAGNVAAHLAPALVAAGFSVVAVWSRTKPHAQSVAAKVGGKACSGQLRSIPAAAIYIICVRDDAIPAVAAELCPLHPGALFLHTAGSVPMDVLGQAGASRFGVLYPLQTFSAERALSFRNVPLFVEGCDVGTQREVRRMAAALSRRVRLLDSRSRRHVHLAAVFACNFVNHCYALAAEEMAEGGLPFRCLMPLIGETARKARAGHPATLQTGPAVRGDTHVLERQAAMLRQSETRAVYEAMSSSIGRVARKWKKKEEKNHD
ncbi:MAG: DUF2520 domain-containing protein [Alloprevotella sp.]|nr:DUF2520 domain-containing protein [Alloprevotella sp.]